MKRYNCTSLPLPTAPNPGMMHMFPCGGTHGARPVCVPVPMVVFFCFGDALMLLEHG